MAYGALKGPKISHVIRSTRWKCDLATMMYEATEDAERHTKHYPPTGDPQHSSCVQVLDLMLSQSLCLFVPNFVYDYVGAVH
jgi:hypothetical protein